MNGSSMTSAAFFTVPAGWSLAAIGDFNGDGKADLFWRHTDGSAVTWLMNGGTILNAIFYNHMGPEWAVSGTGDFYGDGKSEIVWRYVPDGSIYIWRNVDQVAVQSSSLGRPGGTWQVAAIGDFNGDGKAGRVLRDARGTNPSGPSGR